MKIELKLIELEPAQRDALPLCYHAIHSKKLYGRPAKEAMELASLRYGSVEMFGRKSRKLISKILVD